MKKMFNILFPDKDDQKVQTSSSDEIILDQTTDRTADLQEALISANLAFKEKEEAFKEKEESFNKKEEALKEREVAVKEKEESLTAKERLLQEKEIRFAERNSSLNERERRLTELQKSLNEQMITFEENPIKPQEETREAIAPEIIKEEMEDATEVLARLEKIEEILKESAHKDKIIRELHDDLQKKNRNFYAELTRPAIKSIIRIHDFVVGSMKAANQKEGEEPNIALKRLTQAVEGNCQMIEDLLDDEFNITMFSPEKGDPYLPKEHSAIISIETEDPEIAGTIHECRQSGFKEQETGRTVKSAVVSVYKLKRK